MESLPAFGLAASIFQLVDFSLKLLSRSKQIYRSSKGAAVEAVDLEVIANDLIKRINISKAHASLAKLGTDENLEFLYTSCTDVAEELLSILERVRAKDTSQKWPTFKAAIMSVRTQPQVHNLKWRLDSLAQGIQFRHIEIIKEQTTGLMASQRKISEDVQTLVSLNSQKPRNIGYPWEIGRIEDHVKVDDGLGPDFFLPQELCLTLKDFANILSFMYKSRKLPGALQIQQRHFEVLDWNENTTVSQDNWNSVVKGGGAIKISFIMGIICGFPLGKCIRCYKPRVQKTTAQRFKTCTSCGLSFCYVEPDAFAFEPEDMIVNWGPDIYRDHRLKLRPKEQTRIKPSSQECQPRLTNIGSHDIPPLDIVCRRLTIKWEPTFNICHRYLFCRCIIRRSTPSRIHDEITILIGAPCPRHNSIGIQHLDYGNIDYYQDPYFNKFGGYDSFRALIYRSNPAIYQILDPDEFLPNDQIERAFEALNEALGQARHNVSNALIEYYSEINMKFSKLGLRPADEPMEASKGEGLQQDNPNERSFHLDEAQLQDIYESPMMVELREILSGHWLGRPHWAVET